MQITKVKLNFFLDYGICFWQADGDGGGYVAEDLPFSPQTLQEINQFLREFDQNYWLGCPPWTDWTVADCRRFNSEMKRVFALAESELKDQFIICHRQDELIEDAELLADFNQRGLEFRDQRMVSYYGINPDDGDF